jgi:hypothetical protein
VILVCDEDVGTRVPNALKLVGLNVLSFRETGLPLSTPDVQWLTEAGRRGWLVFSCNKRMLDVPVERDTIIRERVGIVFLTSGQERLPNTLRLILAKWEWLELIDQTVPRPFAHYLYPNGRTTRVL